jgi:16S rRNA (cytosine1402-N4)-methyltransferase
MRSHQSVLKEETIALLDVKPSGLYVDATLGRGGHALAIVSRLQDGHLYAFDKDPQALEESREVLKDHLDKVTMIHDDFRHLQKDLAAEGVEEVDGILMDLGVSSPQFDDPARGFSYRYNARLDMRMDPEQNLDAWQVVNTYSEEDLTRILHAYGEERYAPAIARAIVLRRQKAPLDTTFELVEVIKGALPARELHEKGHPAKRTFQALRMEVNHELDALQEGLEQGCGMLRVHGRIAVISFHSLEDRMVKETFKRLSTAPFVEPKLPIPASQMEQASYRRITKKAVSAAEEEIDENHRAHSAHLRVLERIRKD